jgi:glyoxylase-like metal-dependent hydrolase (beta-lactamase superfamily II)
VLEKITPNIAWHPDQDMLAQYLASLDLLLPYEVDQVVPSHGTRFEDHRRVITGTAKHHVQRCEAMLEHLSKSPMTAHELVLALWRRKLSAFHHHFAVFEILAHLEYMSRKGTVAAESTGDGGVKWRPV